MPALEFGNIELAPEKRSCPMTSLYTLREKRNVRISIIFSFTYYTHINLVVDVEPVVFKETVLLWIGTFHLKGKEKATKCEGIRLFCRGHLSHEFPKFGPILSGPLRQVLRDVDVGALLQHLGLAEHRLAVLERLERHQHRPAASDLGT